MKHRLDILALSLTPGIGPALLKHLLQTFPSVDDLLLTPREALLSIDGMKPRVLKRLGASRYRDAALEILQQAEQLQCRLLLLGDPDYPEMLYHIYDPPPFLWIRGTFPSAKHPTVAVVGMRAASDYGRDTAFEFSRGLARSGVCVVSGMARGVDTCAHRGALEGGGPTVAVLGTGIDVIYPGENKALYSCIQENGCIITEYAPGTQPFPGNFPKRNRIISGLCQGTLVVEAEIKSGSLITARLAMEQGRDVYAVPGLRGTKRSAGPHRLIQQGAKLVETFEDILDELPYETCQPGEEKDDLPLPDMNETETGIWAALEKPLHIDELATVCECSVSDIMPVLLNMELMNWVVQLPGMRFKRRL